MDTDEPISTALLIHTTEDAELITDTIDGHPVDGAGPIYSLPGNQWFFIEDDEVLTFPEGDDLPKWEAILDAADWCESYEEVPYIDATHANVDLDHAVLERLGRWWDCDAAAVFTFRDMDDAREASRQAQEAAVQCPTS